jgi:hypothetical protein
VTVPSDQRFFFIHVMKTAGATFRQHVYANFPAGAVYPDRRLDPDMREANYEIAYLLGLPASRHARFLAYTGHFPFVVTDMLDGMLGGHLVTLTIVRDPVDRVISYLKHAKVHHDRHRDRSLEEIYDDAFYFRCFLWNHQTKIFAITEDDQVSSYMDVVEIDGRRLEIAKANLARVDVLGLSERFDEFCAELASRYGWTFAAVENRRVGPPAEVSSQLRRRIAHDNAADLEFYAYATSLYEQRRRSGVLR